MTEWQHCACVCARVRVRAYMRVCVCVCVLGKEWCLRVGGDLSTLISVSIQDFIQQKKYPNWTHVTTVREDAETPLFKQNFAKWIGKDELTKLPTGRAPTTAKGKM